MFSSEIHQGEAPESDDDDEIAYESKQITVSNYCTLKIDKIHFIVYIV